MSALARATQPQVQSLPVPPPCSMTSPPSRVFQGGRCLCSMARRMASCCACVMSPARKPRSASSSFGTQTEREIDLAAVFLHADVEVAFGRAPVALPLLVVCRIETERDSVGADDATVGIEFEPVRAFTDQNARRDERQLERRGCGCGDCRRVDWLSCDDGHGYVRSAGGRALASDAQRAEQDRADTTGDNPRKHTKLHETVRRTRCEFVPRQFMRFRALFSCAFVIQCLRAVQGSSRQLLVGSAGICLCCSTQSMISSRISSLERKTSGAPRYIV